MCAGRRLNMSHSAREVDPGNVKLLRRQARRNPGDGAWRAFRHFYRHLVWWFARLRVCAFARTHDALRVTLRNLRINTSLLHSKGVSERVESNGPSKRVRMCVPKLNRTQQATHHRPSIPPPLRLPARHDHHRFIRSSGRGGACSLSDGPAHPCLPRPPAHGPPQLPRDAGVRQGTPAML